MPHKTRSQGSITIAILILLVVIGVAVAAGYVWYSHHHKPPATQAANARAPRITTRPTNSTTSVVVAAWHVSFPLPADLQHDIYYQTYTSNLGEQGVQFASKKLDGLVDDGYCTFLPQADGKTYGTGVSAGLVRINPHNPGPETLAYFRSQHTYIKTINNYEYYRNKPLKDPPITCTSERHPQFNTVEQTISQELNTAFDKLAASN